jgi:hypothetical protein
MAGAAVAGSCPGPVGSNLTFIDSLLAIVPERPPTARERRGFARRCPLRPLLARCASDSLCARRVISGRPPVGVGGATVLYTVLVVVALATTTGLSTPVSTGTATLAALCAALVAAAAVLLAMPAPSAASGLTALPASATARRPRRGRGRTLNTEPRPARRPRHPPGRPRRPFALPARHPPSTLRHTPTSTALTKAASPHSTRFGGRRWGPRSWRSAARLTGLP